MSQTNKRGFAALYDVQEKKRQQQAAEDFPQPATTHHQSPPVTTTPQDVHQMSRPAPTHAPARDFNRRANSIERNALPQGMFPGASKKIYDALYLRSRGAHPPRKSVRASRRDFLDWTDIRNLKTVDGHLRYLMGVGLIVRHWELGSTEGSEYEVRLPEELPRLTTTPHQSPGDPTMQLSGSGHPQFSGSHGEGQTIDATSSSGDNKTLLKTNTERTTDDEAMPRLRARVGKSMPQTEAVLLDLLDLLESRADVSSPDALMAHVLKKKLAPKQSATKPRPHDEQFKSSASQIEVTTEDLEEYERARAELSKTD